MVRTAVSALPRNVPVCSHPLPPLVPSLVLLPVAIFGEFVTKAVRHTGGRCLGGVAVLM